jgi:putative sterol carrier protein
MSAPLRRLASGFTLPGDALHIVRYRAVRQGDVVVKEFAMASVDECRQALQDLAAQLDRNAETRGKLDLDRTLAVRISDLEAALHARLAGGRLVDIADGDDPKAKIALIAASDDLVALLRGKLDVTRALASRQISVKANPFDLLKLRRLL